MDTLAGTVERIVFYNPENGYSVVGLRPEHYKGAGIGRDGLVTLTGNLPELVAGECLRLDGKWANHPQYGLQFQVEFCEQTLPATVAGIRRYLGSGLIPGIGPRLAERIVGRFGMHTLEVIEHHPERLQEVQDIGQVRSRRIASAWAEQKQVKQIMLFLHSHGVSTNLAVKIYKQYGDESLKVVQSNPYQLAQDIYGIGFKTADRIAQALGLSFDHPSRIEAGVEYALNQATEDGHVYSPRQDLETKSAELLGVSQELVTPAVERLAAAGRIRQDQVPPPSPPAAEDGRSHAVQEQPAPYAQPAVYLSPLYYCETGVADRLRQLSRVLPTRLSSLPPAFVRLDNSLSPEQQDAIRMALSHPVSVLTGGPGTGKTTALKALIAALEGAHKTFALASPTGRAAKRLSQATGQAASTIHRLLGYKPGEGFTYNAANPLPADLVVIDEVSMLDLALANNLLKAISPGSHLLLVGDADQLPSVGAGDVLRDVIESGVVPVTRLSVIFRQAAASQIITNAHRINQGQMPQFSTLGETESQVRADFFFFPAETPDETAGWVEDLVCRRIPRRFGLHPRDGIQVLAPMYRGPAGVTALNTRLQAALNPPDPGRPEKAIAGQIFRVGDKLMQTQNNYLKDVYNGDIGFLYAIDLVEHTLTVDFDGRAVTFDWIDADQMTLAYAISVHKAQGAEFPAVVMPLLPQHYLMLQRNLLYTGVTRARQLCVLVGSRRAIGIAVHNNQVAQRYTALGWRLSRDS
jgi:exodeoxyribonuclease V alpha subunit